MNIVAKELEKYIQERCYCKVKVCELENFGEYLFQFSIFNGKINITYKIDYSKSFEENFSSIKKELLYVIFKS